MSQIIPLGDHVVVEPIEEESVTKGGIVLPQTVSKEKPMRGKVIAVGSGKTDDKGQKVAIEVSVGDVVIFTKYAPTEIKVEGTEYYIISSDSLLAIEK